MVALPDPSTSSDDVSSPLVYLSPHVAHEINLATYIHLASTGVLIWDFLNHLRSDLKVLIYYKIGPQTFVYFATRISLLGYALGRAVLLTAPVEDCQKLEMALNALMVVFVSFTTCIFYLRIHALFPDNVWVKVFFAIARLGSIGMAILFVRTFTAQHIGPTKYCMEGVQGNTLGPTAILLLANDVLVYLAIGYRLYTLFLLDSDSSTEQKMKIVIFGASLPVFWKVIFHHCQLYFLVIVSTKAILVFTIYALEFPYSVMFIICHLVLVNILSGRIYRTIKMSMDSCEPVITMGYVTKIHFAPNETLPHTSGSSRPSSFGYYPEKASPTNVPNHFKDGDKQVVKIKSIQFSNGDSPTTSGSTDDNGELDITESTRSVHNGQEFA